MPSEELKKAVSSYEQFIKTNGISEGIIKAYLQAVKVAVETEKESKYGLYISARVKQLIEQYVFSQSRCSVWELEKYAFAKREKYAIIDTYYEILLIEARLNIVDSALYA